MAKHDTTFKNLIRDYLREALQFFAHVEASHLPPDAILTTLPEERLRHWLGERGAIQDIVVKVEFPSGEREMLVFCIEHNTRESKHLLKRQAKYCIQASIDFETDRIVPVAIFPEEGRKVKKRFKLGTELGIYMDFRCITVKLKELNARRFMKSKNIVARICAPFMKFEENLKFDVYDSAYLGLKKLEPEHDKRVKYVGFLQHYVNLKDEERKFQEERVLGSEYEEDYMSTSDYAVMEGKKEGKLAGIIEMVTDGNCTLANARAQISRLVERHEITQVMADRALKKLTLK